MKMLSSQSITILVIFIFVNSLTTVQAVYSDNCTTAFCGSLNPPGLNFSAVGGTINGLTTPCCASKFQACQTVLNKPTCKEILEYTITGGTANSEKICKYAPGTSPDCRCQENFAITPTIDLKFCPKAVPCCAQCACFGDPHCVAFNRSETITWAVCDDRTVTCEQSAAVCKANTYDGVPCQYKNGLCQRNPSTPIPSMLMYSKNYMVASVVQSLSISLTLGLYGSITEVRIVDGPLNLLFHFASPVTGGCRTPAGYPLNGDNQVIITTLPSGVLVKMQCYNGASLAGRRWDVLYVREPFLPLAIAPAGFCKTGEISERDAGEGETLCSDVDKAIQRGLLYNGKPLCPQSMNLNTCKSKWCGIYSGLYSNFTNAADCYKYVTEEGPGDTQNFLAAVCGSTPRVISEGSVSYSPDQCISESTCSYCMSNIVDYPNQIMSNFAPVPPCPDLIQVGLNRKQLSSISSGVTIQKLVNNVWQSIWAVLDTELTGCGCGNITTSNPILTSPGSYRVLQCAGNSPTTDSCTSYPGYTTQVKYNNPGAGPQAYSTPLKPIFDTNRMICNPAQFPECPTGYKCCDYNRPTQQAAWLHCMESYHGKVYNKPQYADCGLAKPLSCDVVCAPN